jgi:alpha-L-fucosidase 2
LLTNAGFAWFSISYQFATNVTQFGVAIDDVQSAIRFIKSHAAGYRIDPSKLALIGESAGGQLASMAILRGGPDVAVKAVVALYMPCGEHRGKAWCSRVCLNFHLLTTYMAICHRSC